MEEVVDSVFLAAKSKVDEEKPTSAKDSGWRVARVDKPSRDNGVNVIECKVTSEKPEVVKCHLGTFKHGKNQVMFLSLTNN